MKVAITGGIGSGKSTVSDMLRKMGKTVYDADKINAELLTDESYLEKLRENFPEAFTGGELDKKKLAETIFSSDEKRLLLNSIAHPAILSKIEALDNCYVEVPLLVESGAEKLFDNVVVVLAPRWMKIDRIMKRNGLSEEQALRIINAQATDADRIKNGYYSLSNSGDFDDLEWQVEKLAKVFPI